MARSKAGEIFVDLILQTDQFNRQTRATQNHLHVLGGAFDNLNNKLSNVLQAGLSNLARGFAAFGKESIKVGAGFEKTMSQIGAVTNATSGQMIALETHARKLGATTAFTATQAAEAMLELSKAGLDPKQVEQSSTHILKLAGATGAAFSSTARSVVAAIKQFNMGFDETERIVDVFAQATSKSLLDMHSLTEAMKFGGIAGASFGMSLEDTVSALAALRNIGLEGSLAGTNFRMAMAQAAVATSDERKMLERFGLTLKDVSPEFNSFAEILKTVGGAGLGATEGMMVFGRRAGAQMIQLARQTVESAEEVERAQFNFNANQSEANRAALEDAKRNAIDLEAFSRNLSEESQGRAGEMYDKFLDNVSGQTTILLSKVQDVQIGIFDAMKGGLQEFVEDMQSKVDTVAAVMDNNATNINLMTRRALDELSVAVDSNMGSIIDLFLGFLHAVGSIIPQISNLISLFTRLFKLLLVVFAVNRIVSFVAQIAILIQSVIGLHAAWVSVATAENAATAALMRFKAALGPIAMAISFLTTLFGIFFADIIFGFGRVQEEMMSTNEIMGASLKSQLRNQKEAMVDISKQALDDMSELGAEVAFDAEPEQVARRERVRQTARAQGYSGPFRGEAGGRSAFAIASQANVRITDAASRREALTAEAELRGIISLYEKLSEAASAEEQEKNIGRIIDRYASLGATLEEQQRLQELIREDELTASEASIKALDSLAKKASVQANILRIKEAQTEEEEMQEVLSRNEERRQRRAPSLAEQATKVNNLAAANIRLSNAADKVSESLDRRSKKIQEDLNAAMAQHAAFAKMIPGAQVYGQLGGIEMRDLDEIDEIKRRNRQEFREEKDAQDKIIEDFRRAQQQKVDLAKASDEERLKLQAALNADVAALREKSAASLQTAELAMIAKTVSETQQLYVDMISSIESTFMSQVDSREAQLLRIKKLEEKFLEEVAVARKAAAEAGISMTEEMEAYIEAVKEAIAFQKILAGMSDAERKRFEFFSNLIDDRSKKLSVFLENISPLLGVLYSGLPGKRKTEGPDVEGSIGKVEGFAEKVGEVTAQSIVTGWKEEIEENEGSITRNILNAILGTEFAQKSASRVFGGYGDDMSMALVGSPVLFDKYNIREGSSAAEEEYTLLLEALEEGYSSIRNDIRVLEVAVSDYVSIPLQLLSDENATKVNRLERLREMQASLEEEFEGIAGAYESPEPQRVQQRGFEKLFEKMMGMGSMGSFWAESPLVQGLLANFSEMSRNTGDWLGRGEGLGERGSIAQAIGDYFEKEDSKGLKFLGKGFSNLGEQLQNNSSALSVMLSKIGPATFALAALGTVAFKVGKAFVDLSVKFVQAAISTLDRLTSIVFGTSLKGLVGIAGEGITGEEGEEKTPMEVLSEKLTGFFERISNIERFLPAVVNTVVQGLLTAVPQLFNAIASLVPQIIQIMADNAGPLFSAIANGVSSVLSSLPGLADAVLGAFGQITSRLPEIITKIFETGARILIKLPSLFESAMELVFESLMQIAIKITGPQVTKFVLGITQVVSKIAALAVKGVGMLLELLLELAPEIVEALLVTIKGRGFQAALVEAGVIVIEATFKVLVALVVALIKTVVQTFFGLPRILAQIIFTWVDGVTSAGQRLVDMFEGLIESITNPRQSAQEWWDQTTAGTGLFGSPMEGANAGGARAWNSGRAGFDRRSELISGALSAIGGILGFASSGPGGALFGSVAGATLGEGINRLRERRFGDTPGVLRADGGAFSFAPGDYFAAARTPGALLKQAVDAFSSSGGMSRISSPAMDFGFNQMAGSLMNIGSSGGGAMQPSFTSVTVKAEGQVLDSILVRAQRKGHAPEMSRLLRKNSSVRIGLDRGKFAPQSG
jgi:TP901 family phage tail tape measure protein